MYHRLGHVHKYFDISEKLILSICFLPLLCLSVHVSFENYRSLHPALLEDEGGTAADDEEEEEEEEEDVPVAPGDVQVSRSSRRRSKGVPVGMVTKHDPVVCGRKNARNMEKVSMGYWKRGLMEILGTAVSARLPLW